MTPDAVTAARDRFIMRSKTIFGIMLMAVPAVRPLLTLLGIDIPSTLEGDITEVQNAFITAVEALSGLFGAIIATYGRVKAGGITLNPFKKGNGNAA